MSFNQPEQSVYLEDILRAVARIKEYTKKGEKDFLSHPLVQDGVIRQLSIIGEAAAKLSEEIKQKQPDVPWQNIIGMRNIIVHDYSDVNLQTIWNTVEQDLEPLKNAVDSMLIS